MKKILPIFSLFTLSLLSACQKEDEVDLAPAPSVTEQNDIAHNIVMFVDDNGNPEKIAFPPEIIRASSTIEMPQGLGAVYSLTDSNSQSNSYFTMDYSSGSIIQNASDTAYSNNNGWAFKIKTNFSDRITVSGYNGNNQQTTIINYDVDEMPEGLNPAYATTGLIMLIKIDGGTISGYTPTHQENITDIQNTFNYFTNGTTRVYSGP